MGAGDLPSVPPITTLLLPLRGRVAYCLWIGWLVGKRAADCEFGRLIIGETTVILTSSPDFRIRSTTCSCDAVVTSSPLIYEKVSGIDRIEVEQIDKQKLENKNEAAISNGCSNIHSKLSFDVSKFQITFQVGKIRIFRIQYEAIRTASLLVTYLDKVVSFSEAS